MTTPVKPVDAWAVVGPGGEIILRTISTAWRSSVMRLCWLLGRSYFERRGYRCVRVTVAVKEGK